MKVQAFKLFNPEVLTEIYHQLSLQSEILFEECVDVPESSNTEDLIPFEINTTAGSFILSRDQVGEMLNQLSLLDRKDSNPSDMTVGLRGQKFPGFDFTFSDFHPSLLWHNNYKILKPPFDKGRIVETIGINPPKVLSTEFDLWQAATMATLSGLTPDLIAFGSSFCEPADHCTQSYGLTDRDNASWRSGFVVDETGGEHANVVWNLSSVDISQKAIGYLAAHEQAHIVYSKIAQYGKWGTLVGEILVWAKDKPKTKEIWEEFKKLSAADKWEMDYYTHESLDPFFLEKIDPKNRDVLKEKWMMMQATALENKISPDNTKTQDILKLAYGICLGRHLNVDTDLLEAYLSYAHQVCGTKYRQRFELFLTWMEYVGDYGRSQEFDEAIKRYLPSSLSMAK